MMWLLVYQFAFMILNWLLFYAISVKAKLGLQKIIKSDQSSTWRPLIKEPILGWPLQMKVVNLEFWFANISSFGEKGKGLWPKDRRNNIASPNRSCDKRRSKSLGRNPALKPSILDRPQAPSTSLPSEKKKRKKEKGEKRNRPPDRALTALGRE